MLILRAQFINSKKMDIYIKENQYQRIIDDVDTKFYDATTESDIDFWMNFSVAARKAVGIPSSEVGERLDFAKGKILTYCRYDKEKMAHWHLLNAEYWVKNHLPNKSRIEINEIRYLTSQAENDTFFIAKKNMIEGIIHYQTSEISLASQKLYQAALNCQKLGDDSRIEKYQSIISIYQLKAMVENRNRTEERYLFARNIIGGYYIDYDDWSNTNKAEYLDGDTNEVNRLRAWLINLGRVGNLIDDLMLIMFAKI